ncbi:heterodisulfide reductase-related iron-sulfur binding cluster [Ferrimicrobium sp.]|uniref:(Fe-S)-binding protein n=1 Tax=Ferrimicrobium sp. TaxID=2926050 RepID=UPI0026099941|nr:heterodisulfide reductase-related iron-sulfur binding cluster [Ferrimicrobium sp.]
MGTKSQSLTEEFDAIAELSATCVHCGFCLAACPTYSVTSMENDSPRGRIWLLAQAARTKEVNDSLRLHIDRCIGCEACVPACPSGVRYDDLIDRARRVVNVGRSKRELLGRSVVVASFSRAQRFGSLVPSAQALARGVVKSSLLRPQLPRLPRVQALLEQAATIEPQRSMGTFTSLVPNERARVVMLTGCIASVFFEEVNAATVKVLNAEGISVIVPKEQGCCGALASHAGQHRPAQRAARALIAALDLPGIDAVVTNSAGCGAMMKDYGELLEHEIGSDAFSGRVVDVMEFLDRFKSVIRYRPMPREILYHEPCHLAFAQGVRSAGPSVLGRIPGLKLRLTEGPNCCGAGGLYSATQPELAHQVGEAKRDAILEAGIDLLVSGNPGCAIQLNSLLGDRVNILHPIVLLSRAIES